MAELDALHRQRQTAKANVTRIKNLVSSSMSMAELECRLSLVEAYFKQLLAIQGKIENLNDKDNARADLEELCISTKTRIIEFLGDNYKRSSLDSSIAIPFATHSKLPSLDLPKFDGKYSGYKNFISSFKQLVHNDSSLSPIEKFNHLLHCLSGQALDSIRSFQVTAENYKKALERLEQRYDNTTLIFLEHISNLYELPEVQKPVSAQLRSLVDSASAIYSSLKSLGSQEEICHSMLIYLISKKVDFETQIKWKENLDFDKLPSWDTYCKTLERRCQFLESTESVNLSTNQNNRKNFHKTQNRSVFHTQQKLCVFCKCSDHWISGCSNIQAMAHDVRLSTVKKLGLCLNCLNEGHIVSKCLSKRKCKICKKSHHTLLHRNAVDLHVEPSSSKLPSSPFVADTTAVVNSHFDNSSNRVILATAVILICDGSGKFQICRALLDSCSQVNLITERFASILNLRKKRKSVNIVGVGGSTSNIRYETTTAVRSRFNEQEYDIDFLIACRVSGYQPELDVNIHQWNIPTNIDLADENFYQSQRIDVLLGAENFFEILQAKQIKLGHNLPTLQETHFGWVVSGRYRTMSNDERNCTSLLTVQEESSNEDLNLQLECLWSLEEIKLTQPQWSADHAACEEAFLEKVQTLDNGRIQVMLPFKDDPSALGTSYNAALRRFYLLEKRLARDVALKEQYIQFMREYKNLGHMTRVNDVHFSKPHFYIPHHCVLKPKSSSTKLRVVFDASAKTSTQKSLNDILYSGPTIQHELFLILLRFRLKQYAITADIVKMYRMIFVHSSHRRFQQILWREREDESLCTYQLNTVTYGMSASPYLAIRSLHYLADQYSSNYPVGVKVVKTQFYVDDLLSGANNYEELLVIQKETTELLSKGGLELAKFQSNHPDFKSDINQTKNLNLSEQAISSALGVIWDSSKDVFLFSFEPKRQYTVTTKRAMLSLTSSIFDPIGLICPILIKTRVLLQDLWIQKMDWDTEVPQPYKNIFLTFIEDLKNLTQLKIPRFVLSTDANNVQLHGFCDASIRAYGCCIYVRTVDGNGVVGVNLLTAKLRVAPTKKRTLPQLELCGAHLLARLYAKIAEEFHDCTSFLWSDSSVVLHWLKMHSSTLNTFVGNRISEIQELTNNCIWRHVPTTCNPADIVSRGCSVLELLNSIWFSGPLFLKQNDESWPRNVIETKDSETIESAIRKTIFQCNEKENRLLNYIESTSSYDRILRVICWMQRAVRYPKGKLERNKNVADLQPITPKERSQALHCAIWNIQQQYFMQEFKSIEKEIPIKSSLKTLGLFIEQIGCYRLIRVGGRLKNANIPKDRKHPFLLPKDTHFVKAFITYLHTTNFHAGPKALLSFIRQTFWIVGARNLARQIVKSCPSCIRYRPKLLQQVMGDLPPERVTPAPPFRKCGVDFCGPIYTYLKIRGKQPYKCYVAVFVCFVTKAVHIEAVTDLSAEAFIAALKRLVGRRGLPSDIFCDNATNFVGANALLKELQHAFNNKSFQNNILDFCTKNFIKFNFIPPRAPHFGGIWEAAVKSAKGHLYRSLANAKMTFEELSTALVEIEAIMNSRPVAPLSDDPNDYEALTPGHFLVGGPLNAIPEPVCECHDISHLQRWKRITAAKQQFWRKWSVDYLNDMLQRKRWTSSESNIKPNSLVLIHEDNLPPLKWSTGRVVATYPGKDGKVRVADVQTSKGVYRRPIHKLAILSNP